MLTIREPISLKVQKPVQSIRQDMAKRMQANYGIMQMPIRKEEMMHITTEPPEVYFSEGDNLQIVTNIKSENQQELRLDVVNNLINRIMVAQSENFTYQDTVYISSVLRKLGIRDEKTFMKQVFALQNEHNETRQLLKKYENNQEILQILFAHQQEDKKETSEKETLTDIKENKYYIHDEIFKRLETGKIYQDMRSYTKGNLHSSQQIFRTEMNIGEQAAMVQNFHLHALKQKITNNASPLYYLHNNQYEYLQETVEDMSQTLEEQISAAVLLNIVDQSYSLRQQQIEENKHYWYSVAGALFNTAENTWKRYEANLTEQKFASLQMINVMEEVSEVKKTEGDIIENIANEYKAVSEQWTNNIQLQQTAVQQKNIGGDTYQDVNITGGAYHLTHEELQLNFLQNGEEAEEKEPKEITVQQLQKQLEIFNQKNYENYKKLTEIEVNQPKAKERKPDRKKAQLDALRALENPREVLMEYITSDIKDPVQENQKQVESQIYGLFSEETKEIYRQFLSQNNSSETTFLQHIMAQPEENELRQEVMYAVEQVQQKEFVQQIKKQIEKNTETVHPEMTQNINNQLRQQMVSLQNVQNSEIYQIWANSAEIYLPKETETETTVLEHIKSEKEQIYTQTQKVFDMAEKEVIKNASESVRKEILVHPENIIKNEEILLSREKNDVLNIQEKQLTEIRQTVEKQIQKQQMEKIAETEAVQRELRFRQIDLVHRNEEQLITEELLESIKEQQQKTKKEEKIEEVTINESKIRQQTVNESINSIRVNQIENIEDIVQQSVKKQMNNLSDQIYGKLEKKLQTERKRRGYS